MTLLNFPSFFLFFYWIAHKNNVKRSNTLPNSGRPRSVIGDRSTGTRNSLGVNQQNVRVTRRISLGNMNHNVSSTTTHSNSSNSSSSSSHNYSRGARLLSSSPTITTSKPPHSPSTSPIPNRRASMQRSVSRSSSPATFNSSPNGAAPTTRASKYNKKSTSQTDSTTRKWLN
jgi:hypothetical protein